MLFDIYLGIPQWRERWITSRNKRCKGVWDANLEREVLVLRDGRRLSYFLDGPLVARGQSSLPHIFVLHAMFLSGNSFLMKHAPQNYVLVCINRPGYFGSDPVTEEYSFETFAHDMEQLADHLAVDNFIVAGHSSGGPCSFATAAYLGSKRVDAVGILSGDPEYAHDCAPDKHWYSAWLVGSFLPCLLERILPCLPLARGACQGLRNDYRLDTSLYPFRVEDVKQPTLIYVGDADTMLPPHISRHVHSRLDNAHLRILPNVTHMGLLRDEVLSEFFQSLVDLALDDKGTGTVAFTETSTTVSSMDGSSHSYGGGSIGFC